MNKIARYEIERNMGLVKRLDVQFMSDFDSIRRLARKHHRLQEMECNGYGYTNGYTYYTGAIDEWAKKQYGSFVRSAYTNPKRPEDTVFTLQTEIIEAKIKALAVSLNAVIEFQHDPRGATVRITIDGRDLTANLYN